MSLFVQLYDYIEVYDVYNDVWSMLVCSCIDCDNLFLYNISSAVERLDWIGYPNRKADA